VIKIATSLEDSRLAMTVSGAHIHVQTVYLVEEENAGTVEPYEFSPAEPVD